MREMMGIALITLVVVATMLGLWQMHRMRKRRRKEAYWP